jgi:hypothetical protein
MRRVIAALLCAGCIVFATPGAAVPEPLETLAALSVARGPLLSRVALSDEVTIMLVGTALIGLAALVRRAC